jgi:hypothetical protein
MMEQGAIEWRARGPRRVCVATAITQRRRSALVSY